MTRILIVSAIMLICSFSYAQKPRARDLGVPFGGTTGKYNAITDVKGVEIGYSTIISGNGRMAAKKRLARFRVTPTSFKNLIKRIWHPRMLGVYLLLLNFLSSGWYFTLLL